MPAPLEDDLSCCAEPLDARDACQRSCTESIGHSVLGSCTIAGVACAIITLPTSCTVQAAGHDSHCLPILPLKRLFTQEIFCQVLDALRDAGGVLRTDTASPPGIA
jgi:hypothetical protein